MTFLLLMLTVKTGLKTIPTVFADSTTLETAHGHSMKMKRGTQTVTGFSPHTTSAEHFGDIVFRSIRVDIHADGASPC